jgi:hypothetical protein
VRLLRVSTFSTINEQHFQVQVALLAGLPRAEASVLTEAVGWGALHARLLFFLPSTHFSLPFLIPPDAFLSPSTFNCLPTQTHPSPTCLTMLDPKWTSRLSEYAPPPTPSATLVTLPCSPLPQPCSAPGKVLPCTCISSPTCSTAPESRPLTPPFSQFLRHLSAQRRRCRLLLELLHCRHRLRLRLR